MKKFAELRFITADLCCPQVHSFTSINFRVIIGKLNNKWTKKVLIVSRGTFNPFEYLVEILDSIHDFLNDFSLDLRECELLMDLTEYQGLHNPYLFKLEIKNGNINDFNIIEMTTDNLDYGWKKILQFYYDDKLSIFKESLLSTEEKAELIVKALTNSLLDNLSIENIKREIDYKLSNKKSDDFLNRSFYQ